MNDFDEISSDRGMNNWWDEGDLLMINTRLMWMFGRASEENGFYVVENRYI